jgi:sugar lactone lactonase YvrE
MISPRVFDERQCGLGEGPLWHPLREQLFWFDIHSGTLLSRVGEEAIEWDLGEQGSAAGWVDRDVLLIATETGLYRYDLETREKVLVAEIEADDPLTRSNDGRADPHGGFWIGTMGKHGEPGLGSIWRYHQGELRKLFGDITTPNAMCFLPSRDVAFFTDTDVGKVLRQGLDQDGWPSGEPTVFLDLGAEGILPDGAVIDAKGRMWNAQWDIGQMACYDMDGQLVETVSYPAKNTTCPAFGGPELSTVFMTSAWGWRKGPTDGMTYAIDMEAKGLPEYRVDLDG